MVRIRKQHSKRIPPIVLALALSLHAVMFFSLFFGYMDPLFHATHGDAQGVDFFAIYRAGEALRHGTSIYEYHVVYGAAPYASPYRYLPFVAETLGVSLSLLRPWHAYWLWVFLLEVMLFANAWLTSRIVRNQTWSYVCAAMWFAYTPLYVELWIGQFSFLMATLSLWTAALLVQGRPSASTAPWLTSVMTKSNSTLLLPLFARLVAWRRLLILLAVLLLFNLPYFVAFPHDGRTFWDVNFGQYINPHSVPADARLSGDYGFMAFVKSIWFVHDAEAERLPIGVAPAIAVTLATLSLAATFIPRRVEVTPVFALWWAMYFLLYLAWEHSYVMLLPGIVLLVGLQPRYRSAAIIAFVMLAVPTPFVLLDHAFGHDDTGFILNRERDWPAWASVVNHAWKPLPVLMLWSVVCWGEISRAFEERSAGDARSAISAAAAE